MMPGHTPLHAALPPKRNAIALPATLAEDRKYRFGVLHYAYLTVP